jgi:hypothetical protein
MFYTHLLQIKNLVSLMETSGRFDREIIIYICKQPEKEMATHSSILPGKFHRQRNLVG